MNYHSVGWLVVARMIKSFRERYQLSKYQLKGFLGIRRLFDIGQYSDIRIKQKGLSMESFLYISYHSN